MASESDCDSPCVFPRSIPGTVLDDLCSRFLINIPDEERKDVVRLCFQVETAHWFYLDFYRQERPELPACGLKEFTKIIFNKFPFLNKTDQHVDEIFDNWQKYKFSVPVYGAIILNEALDKCLLVQPFMSRTSWGFPKGKVNKDENEFDCAIREVLEETGFDITAYASPDQFLEHSIHDHLVRLYIVPGVPENTHFQTQTKCEIKGIQWFVVDYLPTNKRDQVCKDNLGLNPNCFYMVYPFVKGLRRWISKQGKFGRSEKHSEAVEMSSPAEQQLQKLLEKEEARLEQDRKKAALEKRRKQQQEKFQLQHQLNHPLRQHHHAHRQQLKEARGYQPRDNRSPVEHEQSQTPVRILQRANTEQSVTQSRDQIANRDKRPVTPPQSEPRDQQTPSPLMRLFTGKLEPMSPEQMSRLPFAPIDRAPVSSFYGSVTQPGVIYSSHISDHRRVSSPRGGKPEMDPIMKLRLLTSQEPKEPSQIKDTPVSRFHFTASAFTDFKFDREAILMTLP
ncbi:m7GpppN-mRNA hydrolase [Nematostella vectensis]|uniref:m7GpppN-mRNA hydrolase n=1 Tax=Nematostella vectensis TaxID=45351 RepID=UPI00138FA79E|nr:m7GpppN-mRNA hydrolase [Nematostella vectensis]